MLIATAGALPPGPVADFVERWHDDGGQVSVLTVVEVPRAFLDTLETESWHPFEPGAADEGLEDLAARYVEERGRKRTAPLLAALSVRDIEAEPIFREGDDPAVVIGEVADEIGADLIVMGSTRPIFTEGSWTSVSIRLMRETRRPILLIPGLVPSVDPDRAEANRRTGEQELTVESQRVQSRSTFPA
jgi:nucleotide-binding universal stress UspA family protein